MLFLYSPLEFSHSLVIKDYLNKGRRAKHIPSPAGSLCLPTVLFFYWAKWNNTLTTEDLIGKKDLGKGKEEVFAISHTKGFSFFSRKYSYVFKRDR